GIIASSKSPNIDESPLPEEAPEALAARLSENKAKAIQAEFPNDLIIGSDQVACVDGQILGKPGNLEAAIDQLTAARGKAAKFHTGLALLNSRTGKVQTCVNTTTVIYRDLTDEEIRRYLEKEQPFDCAGSFKSEGLGITILQSINGSDPNALVGLPIIELLTMLRNEGVNPLLD
ncbi:MAG: Maf family nucleotide pyrophosphatase, partial [Pseudomonadota bacterium]|nr:Maf family nucleotide pyrophosphatase [Pseudomonadota bacterium]